jgi:transposase-like protein
MVKLKNIYKEIGQKVMSKKRKTYNAEFKAKIVLEVLEGEKTLNEIASQYDLLPKNIQNWKKQFLENMSLAFDKSAVVKEYKEQIGDLEKQNDQLAKKVGILSIERDWAVGKLKSLDLSIKNFRGCSSRYFKSFTNKTARDDKYE